ncbi:MAG: ankyrin repeat domain-containing protein [Desulfobacteraceae bacterium]|nr:ankyrin repeat domain-containing protein [Desulfobacteraceae bacterium]
MLVADDESWATSQKTAYQTQIRLIFKKILETISIIEKELRSMTLDPSINEHYGNPQISGNNDNRTDQNNQLIERLKPSHRNHPSKANARNNANGPELSVSPIKKLVKFFKSKKLANKIERQEERKARSSRYKNLQLIKYVKKGNTKWVKKWLKAGADVNCLDGKTRTPLFLAASKGHLEVAKDLLSHPKIKVNRSDKFGQTPLWKAVHHGHWDVAKELLMHHDIDMDEVAEYCLDKLVRDNDVDSIRGIASNGYSKEVYEYLCNNAVKSDNTELKKWFSERQQSLVSGYSGKNVPEDLLNIVKKYLNSNLTNR